MVLEANDIVLAKVAARLDLDHPEWDLAWIFERMLDVVRNVRGLVLGEQKGLLVPRHPGGTADDDPMFGTVIVNLFA